MPLKLQHKEMGPATRSRVVELAAKGMAMKDIAADVGWPWQCVAAVVKHDRLAVRQAEAQGGGITPWAALERLVDGLKADSAQDQLRWRIKALMDKARREAAGNEMVEHGDPKWNGVR